MDSYRKHEIKQKLKAKKGWLIGTGLFLIAAIIAFFVGMAMSGVDLIAMMTSGFAVTIYILIGIGLIVFGILMYIIFLKKEIK